MNTLTGCWLDPDNPKVKEEAQVFNENIWTEHHQKSREDKPLKCLVLSVKKKENNESALLHGSENVSLGDHEGEPPLQNNSKGGKESTCWLDNVSVNVIEIKEERQLLDEDVWTDSHQKSLEDQPLKCLVLPVKQEKNGGLWSGSENLSPEGHEEGSLLQNNSKEAKKLSTTFELGNKPKPSTSHPGTSLQKMSDFDECEVCFNPIIKQGSCSCHKRILEPQKSEARTVFSKTSLSSDERTHSDLNPCKCDMCSRIFTPKNNLVKCKQVHSAIKPYKCEICAKAFTAKSYLSKHEQIHSAIRPYKCEICAKAFTTKSYLSKHERIHSAIRPYKCEICAKAFTAKSYLREHEHIHATVRPYKCEICAKAFTRKGVLNKHEQVHLAIRPYKCEICAKAFTAKSYLSKHEQIHSAIRPYKCEICAKAFTAKSYLSEHERIHSGIRPHKCEICAKAFTRKGDLNRHERIHTTVTPTSLIVLYVPS